ncbi:MAG: shikimate dehydrogenase [bacterium]
MQITGKTKVVGLMGWPVKHTFSPIMHNACFSQLNMDWVYLPFEVKPKGLKNAIFGLSALGIVGVNVTIPHKIEAMKYLTEIDERAKKIGAVNTILFKEDEKLGFNTDGEGFVKSLKDAGFEPKGKNVLLIGCGGAGRAIAVSLAYEGVKTLSLFDIQEERKNELCGLIKDNCCVQTFNGEIESYDLIINATPLGMKENDPLPLDVSSIHSKQIVYDIIYNPPKTRLLIEAEKRGARIINGVEMLIHQGALSFEIWTGVYPRVEVMRRVISQGSGVRGQESGVRGQGSGVRGQGSGVRGQGSGVKMRLC